MLAEYIRSSFNFSCKIDINDRVNNLSNFIRSVALILSKLSSNSSHSDKLHNFWKKAYIAFNKGNKGLHRMMSGIIFQNQTITEKQLV